MSTRKGKTHDASPRNSEAEREGGMNEVAVNGVTFRIGDIVRVGRYVGELIQVYNEDLVTVDLGENFDDGMNDGFAEVNPKLWSK